MIIEARFISIWNGERIETACKVNVDTKQVFDIADGIYDLIDELDEGLAVGLPYNNMDILNKESGGQLPGNITLIGGLSNMGKTTLTRSMLIPSTVKYGERLVICVNEEGKKKWQRELLVWVANNIYKQDLQKFVVRDGKYSSETKELLHKCADWIVEKSDNNMLTIIPFKRYKTQKFIRVLKKYANLGVKYFILDTYKADSGSRSDRMWLDALEEIVNYAMDKDIPYFALNVPNDMCTDCGYTDEIGDKCPMCGGDNIRRLRRVTGYLTGDYKSAFNIGKQQEVEMRVKHMKGNYNEICKNRRA